MVQSQIVQSIAKKYNNASFQIRVLITQKNLSSLLAKNDPANSLFTPNSGIIFCQNTNKIRDSLENHFLEIEGGLHRGVLHTWKGQQVYVQVKREITPAKNAW